MKLLIAAVTVVSLSVLAGGQAEAAEAAGVDPRVRFWRFPAHHVTERMEKASASFLPFMESRRNILKLR